MDAPLRLAVVSTPRTGNTWLRHLIAGAYRVPSLAVHELTPDVLAGMPEECVVQVHWRKEPGFEATLAVHGFRVVSMVRHPFDVLLSILQFCVHDSESNRWLLGRGGNECGIFAATPRSRAFVEYACGPRAKELLGVSADWWNQPGTVGVKYEDLVADPLGELRRVTGLIAPPRHDDLGEVVGEHGIGRMRRTSVNNHFWKGQPGHWRALLTAAEVSEIAAAHRELFATLGYAADADPALDAAAADRNWVVAAGPGLQAALAKDTIGHKVRRDYQHVLIADLTAERDALAAQLAVAENALVAAREEAGRLKQFDGLQGLSLRVGWAIQHVRNAARAIPRVVGRMVRVPAAR